MLHIGPLPLQRRRPLQHKCAHTHRSHSLTRLCDTLLALSVTVINQLHRILTPMAMYLLQDSDV